MCIWGELYKVLDCSDVVIQVGASALINHYCCGTASTVTSTEAFHLAFFPHTNNMSHNETQEIHLCVLRFILVPGLSERVLKHSTYPFPPAQTTCRIMTQRKY
jgi:hypothetical protein